MQNENMIEEIDIEQLVRTLWHRKWIVLLCTVLCAGLMFGYGKATYRPSYSSSAKMIINTSWEPGETVTTDPLKTAISLADSYQVLIKSNEVLEKVAENPAISESAGSLSGKISVSVQSSTPIMQITVTDSDAQHARDICETVTKVAAETLPTIIGDGVIIDVVSPASYGYQIGSSLNKKVVVAGGFGFVASVAWYILKFFLNNRINTESDIARYLDLNTVGVIPDYKHDREKLKKNSSPIRAGEQASFSFNEAYKALGTNVSFLSEKDEIKVIMITSSAPKEGKSTAAMNLASTLAERGKKVTMVDADLRIGTPGTEGVADLLRKESCEYAELMKTSDNGMYTYLPAGTAASDALALLSSKTCSDMIEKLKSEYDYVIIDAPSAAVVTDAAILSRYTDGILLVVEAGGSTIESAQLAERNLQAVNANMIGAVLIGYDSRRFGKRDGYYYNRKYGKHYYGA